MLLASDKLAKQLDKGKVRRRQFSLQAQYYLLHGRRWLFYAGVLADLLTQSCPDAATGRRQRTARLRGDLLRYQSGARRALVTVEERFHPDLYP